MSWDYRVLKTDRHGVTVWAVHEVYYHDDGTVKEWTEWPAWPTGETWQALRDDLDRYMAALTLPPLDVSSGVAVAAFPWLAQCDCEQRTNPDPGWHASDCVGRRAAETAGNPDARPYGVVP